MVMNQFTRGPLFIDRDGHKVGRPVVVQTYQKHPTDSNGSRSSVIFEKKTTSSNIIKPDIMLIDIIQQKKGIGPPIK